MNQLISNFFFKRKLKKLGFDMSSGSENERLATTLNERGLGGNHFIKCMEGALLTKRLQEICEVISGRKEAGRYLQKEPLVIQCHSCQKDFSIKEGVTFAGEKMINLENLENIIKHLITCKGIICDCGKNVFYFDKCKKCGLEWDKRSIYLGKINQQYVTEEQKKQVKIYRIKYLKELLENSK
jgi:hypothetical protein